MQQKLLFFLVLSHHNSSAVVTDRWRAHFAERKQTVASVFGPTGGDGGDIDDFISN
jgi:hypothetical protein